MKLYREVNPSEGEYVLRPVDPDNIESILNFVKPIEITEGEIEEWIAEIILDAEMEYGVNGAYEVIAAKAILDKLKKG